MCFVFTVTIYFFIGCVGLVEIVIEEVETRDIGPNACHKDPCRNIARAVVGSCNAVKDDDFECHCQLPFAWDDDSNSCMMSSSSFRERTEIGWYNCILLRTLRFHSNDCLATRRVTYFIFFQMCQIKSLNFNCICFVILK